MKRKIAFRAWDKEKKCFLSQSITKELEVTIRFDGVFVSDDVGIDGTESGDRIVLSQFTGLHDKNGKEVFEGDVVKCSEGCPHEIVLGGGNGMPGWWLEGTIVGLMGDYDWTGREEVIGDIYSNPELLKGESL